MKGLELNRKTPFSLLIIIKKGEDSTIELNECEWEHIGPFHSETIYSNEKYNDRGKLLSRDKTVIVRCVCGGEIDRTTQTENLSYT